MATNPNHITWSPANDWPIIGRPKAMKPPAYPINRLETAPTVLRITMIEIFFELNLLVDS